MHAVAGTRSEILGHDLAELLVINVDPNRAPEETTAESIAEFRNLNEYVR